MSANSNQFCPKKSHGQFSYKENAKQAYFWIPVFITGTLFGAIQFSKRSRDSINYIKIRRIRGINFSLLDEPGRSSAPRFSEFGRSKDRRAQLSIVVYLSLDHFHVTEIAKVRASLFQISGVKKEPLILPEPEGEITTLTEKVYVPVKEHPDVSITDSHM